MAAITQIGLEETAADLIIDHARNATRKTIARQLRGEGITDPHAIDTVAELIAQATITISWPDGSLHP